MDSMKLYPAILALPLLLVACGDDDDEPPPDEKRLVIFHTNDEHSHLFGFAPEVDDHPTPTTAGDGTIHGGIARRARLLKEERAAAAAAGIDTVTASAGDETQGALPQVAFATDATDFKLMKELGYDVMCPGNHEFDLGPGAYAAAIGAAMAQGGLPQIVSTNIHFDDASGEDDTLAALYGEGNSTKPIKKYHVVTTESGIKVGFFGVMGVQASYYAPLKVPVRFSVDGVEDGYSGIEKVYDDIRPTIAALRDVEQVDVVIMVSHGGVDVDQPEVGDDYQVGKNVAGIDAIISGHSHTPLAAPQVVTGPDGHQVPIVQAGSFGEYLGRLELVITPGERPTFDAAKTKLIAIDDKIVPDDTALVAKLEGIIKDLEANTLPAIWKQIEGVDVPDDPAVVGDLYFRSVGVTDFDVVGLRASQETNILNLSTDAMLATARDLAGPTAIGVQAAGSVRGDIIKGKTGKLTLADLYRIFPLGVDPTDGSVGYPLCRFFLWKVEIKGALEIAVSQGLVADSVFLSPSGLVVEFDTARAAAVLSPPTALLDPENGRVTRIYLDNGVDPERVIFDLAAPDPWMAEAGVDDGSFQLFPVVTSLYVGSFAGTSGVMLKDALGEPIALNDTIIERPDGSHVKEYEAFIAYIRDQAAANGGKLPSIYDESTDEGAVPRRMLCSGPLCP